jgi:predicted XRE-type DNA-binding protein
MARATTTIRGARAEYRRTLRRDAIPRDKLAMELQRRIVFLGLSRNDAAAAVDDAASQLSRLMTGHVLDFSADRIVKMLLRLGCDVEVIVKHRAGRKRGRVSVRRG